MTTAQYSVVPTRRATAEAIQILMQHLFGDAFSPLLVGAVSHCIECSVCVQMSGPGCLPGCVCVQISDTVHRLLGRYEVGDCTVSKGVALEFALFTTPFVCALGVAAFLALTLTVEADRRVSRWLTYSVQYFAITAAFSLIHRQWRSSAGHGHQGGTG